MSQAPERGKGPWPSDNQETSVRHWLGLRLGHEDESERVAMVRWMLDAVSQKSRGERVVDSYRWPESQLDRLAVWAECLKAGEPLQHLLGEVWFDGMRLVVGPEVLIPRPETEELVAAVASRVIKDAPLQVVDWCTGSGCIALALKHRIPHAHVTGVDVSAKALELAQTNRDQLQLDVTFQHGDLLAADPWPVPVQAVTANPPYIPNSERQSMDKRVVDFEPEIALFVPDETPLLFYEKLIEWCGQGNLCADGLLAVECHMEWTHSVAKLFQVEDGWKDVEILEDLQGNPRHVLGRRALP